MWRREHYFQCQSESASFKYLFQTNTESRGIMFSSRTILFKEHSSDWKYKTPCNNKDTCTTTHCLCLWKSKGIHATGFSSALSLHAKLGCRLLSHTGSNAHQLQAAQANVSHSHLGQKGPRAIHSIHGKLLKNTSMHYLLFSFQILEQLASWRVVRISSNLLPLVLHSRSHVDSRIAKTSRVLDLYLLFPTDPVVLEGV